MKRKLIILGLALALVMSLSGCGVSGGDDGEMLFGRNILYTRAATDDEAFSQSAEDEDVVLRDESVPLSGLPTESEAEEGWILVRYAEDEDGSASPLWYRIWTADGRWSDTSVPFDGADWHPVIP